MLTPKQAIFVAEYLISRNAKRAAIAARYSEKTAEAAGSRLLRNVKVSAVLAERNAQLAQKYEITVERTTRKLAEIGYGDIRDLYDEDGSLLPLHRMSEEARTMLAGLEVESVDGPGRVRTITHKPKIADRIRALELLGKYQKIFTDRVEHDGRVTLEQLVAGARNGGESEGDEE